LNRGGVGGPSTPLPRVRIVTPKEAIRVNYEVVRDMVPSFWDDVRDTPPTTKERDEQQEHEPDNTADSGTKGQAETEEMKKNKYDFVLHIGMAGPQPMYQLERRAHRDGYRLRDVDGNMLGDDERHAEQGENWIWHGVPHELLTDLDVEAVYKRWVGRSPKRESTTLRISDDPGRYLCDFIYFSSLAHLWKQGKPRDVVFLHVPAVAEQGVLDYGRELVLQLLRSIVEVHFAGYRP